VIEIILSGERNQRAHLMMEFDWLTKRREELIEEHNQMVVEARVDKLRRESEFKQARIDALLHDAECLEKARTIRDYVKMVSAHISKSSNQVEQERFESWAKWAIGEADRIDPLIQLRFLDAFEIKL
jgi:hypothetical protein